MQYSIPKGVYDILPEEKSPEEAWRVSYRWEYVEAVMRKTAHDYGFKEIRTPMFERTELFVRSVGESSDIVTKEMYTFLDKADRSMTLRPEGTAPAMRSFVEEKLHLVPGAQKLFYIGPMFRYERQQAGRYRQHYQFGAEAIGASTPEQDVEMIDMMCELYKRLGLQNLVVMINSVGDASCREPYRARLMEHLRPHLNELSPESQARFSKNVLRILDSKDANDQKLLEGAPSILDCLNEECRVHFERAQELLKKLGHKYVITPKLVRGLDYYNKTVFEIISGDLGAHNTIGAGGRFDGLLADLGGPNLPAVGFATGIERILQTMLKQNVGFPESSHPLVFLVPLGDAAKEYCFLLAAKLRHSQIPVEVDLSGKKVQHGLQLANALRAEYTVVIGEEELASREVKIKDMLKRDSQTIKLSDLESHLQNLKRIHV